MRYVSSHHDIPHRCVCKWDQISPVLIADVRIIEAPADTLRVTPLPKISYTAEYGSQWLDSTVPLASTMPRNLSGELSQRVEIYN